MKAHLNHVFGIKDLGILHYFLGIEVGYVSDGIVLIQQKFAKELLATCEIDYSKSTSTPFPLHSKLSSTTGDLLPSPEEYRFNLVSPQFLENPRNKAPYHVLPTKQSTGLWPLQHLRSHGSFVCLKKWELAT